MCGLPGCESTNEISTRRLQGAFMSNERLDGVLEHVASAEAANPDRFDGWKRVEFLNLKDGESTLERLVSNDEGGLDSVYTKVKDGDVRTQNIFIVIFSIDILFC